MEGQCHLVMGVFDKAVTTEWKDMSPTPSMSLLKEKTPNSERDSVVTGMGRLQSSWPCLYAQLDSISRMMIIYNNIEDDHDECV